MLLSGGIKCLKRIFFPASALLCLGIGASCARGTNESLDLANESPDVASESPDVASESPDIARLETFLSAYYERPHQQGQPQIRAAYNVAAADLDGDQVDELLVYLRSENFCVSGGCMLLILTPQGDSFRTVAEMIKVRLPVRVLDSRSNGWRDLTVTVQGGGQIEPLEIELAYDGETYPTDPTRPPARRLEGVASGEILFDRNRQHQADGEFVISEPCELPTSFQGDWASAARLNTFLSNYLKERYRFDDDVVTRVTYLKAAVDLNSDDSDEVLVYINGDGYCGNGGCSLLILTPQGESYRTVTRLTIVKLPIRVLDIRSNGWRTLTVIAEGGGQPEPVEIELAFDGESYPTNPSVPPARPLQGAASGEILIDDCRRNLVDGEVLVRGT